MDKLGFQRKEKVEKREVCEGGEKVVQLVGSTALVELRCKWAQVAACEGYFYMGEKGAIGDLGRFSKNKKVKEQA